MKNLEMINSQGQPGMNFVETGEPNALVDLLNDLIMINWGIIDVYQTALNRLENKVNAKLLHNYVDQHNTFVTDLSNVVVRHSGDPATSGTSSSLIKQAWVTLKAILTEGDGPILGVVAKDAKTVMVAYAEAMSAKLPDDVRDVIRGHMSESRLNYEKLSALSAAYNID